MVYHLAYASIARQPLGRGEIDDILAVSRRNNAACGITGMLIYGGGSILQALEGEREAVEALYAAIVRDPRHYDLRRLMAYEDDRRDFGDWPMAYVRAASAEQVDGLITALDDETLANRRLAKRRPLERLLRTFLETVVQ